MLDRELLRSFMQKFFGYGNWSARLWFVGMEEGGGNTLDEMTHRLAAWDPSVGLADLREFHKGFGEKWFRDRPPIQSTWGKLIRLALCAEGRQVDTESVRRYQRDELGRRDGTTALMELFPLPSPSTRDWPYADCGIPEIATRADYRAFLRDARISSLRERIDKHEPRTVVLYGRAYRRYWEQIAGAPFVAVADRRFEVARRGSTLLILAPHPAARGVRNASFSAIGEWIRDR